MYRSRASFNIQSLSELELLLRQLGSDELNVLAVNIGAQYEQEYRGDDQEFRNHILFLRHAQTYMLLKYAIKQADIGLIRRAIDRCALYFHGSPQKNYANLMLYFQYLFRNSEPDLCRAILSNSLVNCQGKSDSWFEIDRLVELHNGNLKEIYTARRGSMFNVDQLFQNYALSSDYLTKLVKGIYRVFSIRNSGESLPKEARIDITNMAEALSKGSLQNKQQRIVQHNANDIETKGAIRISECALSQFNYLESFSFERLTQADMIEEVDALDDIDTELEQFFEFQSED